MTKEAHARLGDDLLSTCEDVEDEGAVVEQELQELARVRGCNEQDEAAELSEADAVHTLSIKELTEEELGELQLAVLLVGCDSAAVQL